jgi:hypothetical protein
MKTLPKQISLFTEDELTSSQEDSPASPTQWPESDLEKKMSDTSGRRCLERFEKFGRVGLWAKMFSALLIGQEGWYSTRCRLTWKLKGTRFNRMYFQLYPSTHRTEETEFGLLPTPQAMDMMQNPPRQITQSGRIISNQGHNGSAPLKDLAMNGLLPTPIASDIHHAERVKTLKETRAQTMASRKNGAKRPNGLMDYLDFNQMLPTPTAQVAKHGHSDKYWDNRIGKRQMDIAMWNAQTNGKTSQLSPQFVLEMMGFPTDWTELPFLSGETNQSKPEEMP